MKQTFYIAILSLLLVASVSGIAFLVYPDLDRSAISDTGVVAATANLRVAPSVGSDDHDTSRSVPVSGEPEMGAPDSASDRQPANEEEPARTADTHARLYLVLDDGGHSVDQLRQFGTFDGVFTVAVLPGLEYSQEVARMSVAMGHELILHQPMEALGGNDPGPGAILTAYDNPQIRRTLRRNLTLFPEAIGVNNHMGSKATGDTRVMAEVAGVLSNRHLFFLDSRTIHNSVGDAEAARVGLPALRRDVFLDNDRNEEAIAAQIDTALEIAREQGYAVMIGHLTSPELARVLMDRYDEITAAGYRFAPLSELAAGKALRIAHEDTGN